MPREARKYLYDIDRAATLVAAFTAGKTFSDYQNDPMLRAAVERKFERCPHGKRREWRGHPAPAASPRESGYGR